MDEQRQDEKRNAYTLTKTPSWLIKTLSADPSWSDVLLFDYSLSRPEKPAVVTRPDFLTEPKKAAPSSHPSLDSLIINDDEEALSQEHMRYTMKNFDDFRQAHNIQSPSIAQKLELIREQWQKKRLPRGVEKHLFKISSYLSQNNVAKADEMFLKLMMSHASDCHDWSGGIIDLIQSAKKRRTSRKNKQ